MRAACPPKVGWRQMLGDDIARIEMEPWKTIYPTLADAMRANFSTLLAWDEHLPVPQTDVQRTVRRRIKKQLFALAGKEFREKAPEIADGWNDLIDKIGEITGLQIGRAHV